MKKLTIFEPALCCPTGVCGPSVDSELLLLTGLVNHIRKDKSADVKITRRNLAQSPETFAKNENVKQLIEDHGIDILPVTLVDEEVYLTGRYPNREEYTELTGVSDFEAVPQP